MATSNNASSTVSASVVSSAVSTVNSITISLNTMNVSIFSATVSSVVIVLARALRPATATRASLKAVARKAMAKASRRANRVSYKARRTQSVRMVTFVTRYNRAATKLRLAKKAARVITRANANVFAKAFMTVATTVQARVVATSVLVGEVHTCAAPGPVLVAQAEVEYVPLAIQRPEVSSYRHARKVLATTAIEVEPTTTPAVVMETVLAKAATKAAKDAAAVIATRTQAENIIKKAERKAEAKAKKAMKSAASTPKAKGKKGKKADKGVTSERKGAHDLVKAGPTNGNDYGWTPMSDMELASFFYGDEVDGVSISDMGLSEVPTPMTSVPCASGFNDLPSVKRFADLYNLVLNMAITANNNAGTSANDTAMLAPKTVKVVYVNGKPMNPAKAFTLLNYPTPEGFYALESGKVSYKSVNDKGTYSFNGEEGTFYLMMNARNGSVFMKNSHIRAFTGKDGVQRIFNDFLQKSLDKSVEAHNETFFALVKELEEGDCAMESEEAFEEAISQLGQPIKHILLEATRIENEDGTATYVYDLEAFATLGAEYEPKGYEVQGIKPSLLFNNITIANFRLDNWAPCNAVEPMDIRGLKNQGITSWTADNIHHAVKPVTDLQAWLKSVMPNVTAISFSFNGATEPKRYDSVVPVTVNGVVTSVESTVHQYSLTTDPQHYADHNLEEGVVPAWTINLWTGKTVAKSLTNPSETISVVENTEVFVPRAGGAKKKTSLLAEMLMQMQQANSKKGVVTAAPIVRPPTVSASMRRAEVETMDTVPAVNNDSVSGNGDVLTSATAVQSTAVERDALESITPVIIASNTQDDLNNQLGALVFDADELCQLISLKDINMTHNYLSALTNLSIDLGLTIQALPADSNDLGSYNNGVISIADSLSDNHRAQVLVHELVHNLFNSMEEATVTTICEDWLNVVGQSTVTPVGVSLVEQFAYSFMEHAHDVYNLVGFLTQVDGWEVMFNALEDAAEASKAVISTAPIAIVVESNVVVTAPVVSNPVLDALLVTAHDVLVLTDEKGTLPSVYGQAFPGLVVRQLELGSVDTVVMESGLVVHAICGVTSQAALSVEAMKAGLQVIADMGSNSTSRPYICEADLGFGGGITNIPTILGAVRQALGQAKVKTISLPAMKRLAKEFSNAGEGVKYQRADLSLWTSALMKGTAIEAVPTAAAGDVFNGNPCGTTNTAVQSTMAILNGDGTINAEALAQGLVELEGYITSNDIPMPIYCYSCQLEAFNIISVGVTPVEYAKGVFLSTVKVGVLDKSPIEGETLTNWHYYLVEAMKGEGDGMLEIAELSSMLFTNAFKAMGLSTDLAAYALSPLPLSWLQHGIVLVVPGKNAKGLIDTAVAYEDLIDKALLNILVDRGIKIYTAEYAFDKAAKKSIIKGKEAEIYGLDSSYGVCALPTGLAGNDMLQLKDGNEFEYVNNNVIGMKISDKAVHTLDNYMQKHLLDTIQYLIDSQGVEVAIQYMEAALPGLVKNVTQAADGKVQYHLSVYNKTNPAEYYMVFTPEAGKTTLSARHCTIISGSAHREVNAITNLSGFPDAIYNGVAVALGLAISAAAGRKLTQDAMEGYLAGTTNLWARSENYGLALKTIQTRDYSLTDTLKVIIDNSGKTISSTPNQNVDAKGVALGRESTSRWPYHMPCNASLDLSVMESLMKKGELVLCDKYAMERIIIGDGARAMLASILTVEEAAKLKGYDEEVLGLEIALNETNGNAVYTVCWPTDKASKALNRPSQFHGSSQADGWKELLEWCPLTTDLGSNNRSGVRGFKRTFIAAVTDTFSQGSGAASQHPDASVWAFKVNGSMYKNLDWHQVPATQENVDDKGNHLPGFRCSKLIMGPDNASGPAGKDKDGKEVPAMQWFCGTFSKKYVVAAIEKAMYTPDGEYRVYHPEEEMVVLFDKMITPQGEKVGYFPNGNTPGLPSARTVLFSNDLGKQNCIITGYEILPLQRGERLQIVLKYATVMDTRDDSSEWSGAKGRGLGIKFIISHDGTINYLGATAPHNGVETNLNDLYTAAGAIHVTSEGLKGNYALMQGFAAAHGAAHESGPYLCIDQYMQDGTPNPHYVEGDVRMVSDMTDTSSYFYQWVRSNTRTIRMQKSMNASVWKKIQAYNKGVLPGVEVVDTTPRAIQWDAEDANGEQVITDAATVAVEYDVQVIVFDFWVQVEVAPPGACTGNQGMTAEQASNLEVMLPETTTRLWGNGKTARTGVENAVKSAETHALVEANQAVAGIFNFNPLNKSHNDLMQHLLYQVSATGVRTLRPAKEFYLLLATIFGGAAINTTALWTDMALGLVSHIDYIDGKVVTSSEGYNYMDSVDGLQDLVLDGVENNYNGKGLAIHTSSEETGGNTVTYIDPTVFIQLGAFENVLVAADPKTQKPSRRVSGAATGIVNDIHDAFHKWTTTEFWSRKGATGAAHGINSKLRRSMMGWIGVNSKQATMMNAKGVLGRIARIDQSAGVAGKVCTGIGPQYAPHLYTDENGVVHEIPVAIMHPDCLLAKGLKHGDIVGVGRTPTVSLAFCVVKFSRTYGRIGYIHMCFTVWAAGNNGDTDGDPCNRIRVGGVVASGKWKGVSYAQAVKLNKHQLGMGGYEIVCGPDASKHDCADFTNFKGVWTKKALNNNPEAIPALITAWLKENNLKVKGLEPLVNLMLPATLLDSAKKVSQHYRANVGVAYGWCSAYSAHMKEKHSFLEAVVAHLLTSELALSYGAEAPTVETMMEVLVSGDLYTALNSTVQVAATEPAPTEATPTQPEFYTERNEEAIAAIYVKYPIILALCEAKIDAANNNLGNSMNLVEMGQHIKVMLEASAHLWRGIYEGLGLSGYSPDASAFFEAFGYAMRGKGMIKDASLVDKNGKITLIQPARVDNSTSTKEGEATDISAVTIGQFISTHYGMSLETANEIFAACLLYNGYRAIERGQHEAGDDEKQLTTLEVYNDMYAVTMSEWSDTKGGEFLSHAVLAGVFRRAGQGTTGVSLDDNASDGTSAQMIYTFAQDMWADKLAEGKAVFRNPMLNEIVMKSVTLYNKLVSIASIDAYDESYGG